jgi:hypothetical protein
MNTSYEISFATNSDADAAKMASRLEEDMRDALPSIDISRKKTNAHSQDFGTTLVVVLGTPVAAALASAVGAFLKRNSGASIVIKRNGEVVASNLNSADAARIAEAFAAKPAG